MTIIQGEVGRIRMFEDFLGAEIPLALATTVENLGQFRIGGQNITNAAAGLVLLDTDGLNGIAELTTGDTNEDTTAIMSAKCFDAGYMGTLVLETRLRLPALTAKAVYVGFTDVGGDSVDLATDVINYSTTVTITITASHLCGFYLSSELVGYTEDWHAVHKGGTTAVQLTTTDIDLDNVAVEDEFQILRLEVDNNGTARWYIDGVLLKTLEGAMSTTGDVMAMVAVTENGGDLATMEVDYVMVEANRDWTV